MVEIYELFIVVIICDTVSGDLSRQSSRTTKPIFCN